MVATPHAAPARRLSALLPPALVLGAAPRVLAQACAMCGSALTDDPLGRAFSWSILFMMAAPYAIVGAVAGWLFITYRRALGRRRAAIIDPVRRRRGAAGEPTGGDVP